MNVRLYLTMSPANMVQKQLTLVTNETGTLREPTSILDPTFVMERNSPTGFNYVYIEEFGRYYYVSGVSSVSNSLVAVSCHVDVLMTYSNYIRELTAVVRRQENDFNLLLDDGIFKAYQNPKHKLLRFPFSFEQFSYILAIAGNGDS